MCSTNKVYRARRVIPLVLLIAAGAAVGQDVDPKPNRDTRAIEVVSKADAATRAVKLVSYDVKLQPTGWLAKFTGPIEGSVVLGGELARAKQRFRFDITVAVAGSTAMRSYSVRADRGAFSLIDHAKKTVYTGDDYEYLGDTARATNMLRMAEFIVATPFSDELAARVLRYDGMTKVAGEQCHNVYVVYNGGAGESRWFFSTTDYLPRRVDRIRRHPVSRAEGATELTLSNLVVDLILEGNPFERSVPEGYAVSTEAP